MRKPVLSACFGCEGSVYASHSSSVGFLQVDLPYSRSREEDPLVVAAAQSEQLEVGLTDKEGKEVGGDFFELAKDVWTDEIGGMRVWISTLILRVAKSSMERTVQQTLPFSALDGSSKHFILTSRATVIGTVFNNTAILAERKVDSSLPVSVISSLEDAQILRKMDSLSLALVDGIIVRTHLYYYEANVSLPTSFLVNASCGALVYTPVADMGIAIISMNSSCTSSAPVLSSYSRTVTLVEAIPVDVCPTLYVDDSLFPSPASGVCQGFSSYISESFLDEYSRAPHQSKCGHVDNDMQMIIVIVVLVFPAFILVIASANQA
eukprot:CAMPEP_0113892588 /NCGR_PEP_ID=MMETSP0780_2-20120614/15521_1 /TAXON_ID=652834 /ORGANISM="Palpitomonas bilix" /LENGTH=320 /DNA_ID=CAMNT_0000882585 /DNA_START=10 /DNA_END=968 /DNA_ORIENTATION=- /assembly_acc=CAM_ASM_000599